MLGDMSGKGDKHDKTSGSKMLKKARSFREDVKGFIKRRPSNSGSHGGTPGKPKIQVNGGRLEDRDPDLQKLQHEVDNVYRSLGYIKAVIDQEKPQIILVPNTATVVLEHVNDVFLILNSFFLSQESSSLTSRHSQVCQSLAHFIKWSDDLLLNGNKALFNKDSAHQLISALCDGMEELYQICLDKWENRNNTAQSPQKSLTPKSPGPHSPTSKNNSLPDIPLTPREREILENTSDLGIYDNTGIPVSRSADSVTMNNGGTKFEFPPKENSPPPKPPLPQNAGVIVPQLIQKSMSRDETDGGEAPPPLPDKTKRRSQIQNMLEMVSNAGLHAGHMTPSNQSPHNSMILSGNVSCLDYSMNSSNGSLHSQTSCPSPSSSVSSGLNQSAEDLMSDRPMLRSGNFSKTVSDSTLVKRSVVMSSSHSECTVNQINQLTQEIDKLTKLTDDMQAMTRKNLENRSNLENVPPLPNKASRANRLVSHYDNVPDGTTLESGFSLSNAMCNRTVISQTISSRTSQISQMSEARLSSSSTSSTQSFSGIQMQKSNTISFCHQTSSQEDAYSSSGSFSSASHSSMDSIPRPPPLPPKQKHIQTYMQTIGAYTQPQGIDAMSRHSMHFYEAQWQRHQMELSHTIYPRSNTFSVISDFSSDSSFGGSAPGSPIPALPVKRRLGTNRDSQLSTTSSQSDTMADIFRDKTSSLVEPTGLKPQDMEQKRASAPAGQFTESPIIQVEPEKPVEKAEIAKDADSDFAELNPLDDIDVSDQLVYKNAGEDGPDIRGGSIDALIVHATAANKTEFMYQEAFLTTYRTYIASKDLIDKLLYRFNKFQYSPDIPRKKSAKNALFLLIRVIDLMSLVELDEELVKIMMDLVFELLCQGDLNLARVLRSRLIEKCKTKKEQQQQSIQNYPLSSISVTANPQDLLHFKSSDIAEQMTLIDAGLFQQIEIPEVLLWAKEQSEELSPNLTKFTEHFNKMSYWCRTRILLLQEVNKRERYMLKFIKIMKHLRKMNNFNSYLALLSALDSAPVRRLDWPKQHVDALNEFCLLIESSGSFRAYRQALSETDPPCIPYIGLILQDLTFINIGNQDYLPDGSINFAKRWQQFNILDSMRRFRDKKCNYEIKQRKDIVTMFDNFNDYMGEEALWSISEEIKPRGGKKKVESEL
ncbi:Rap guanine nucleotide exchange factor 1 [Mactra antiquata]